MHVSCPQCTVAYLLPERLLGPGGARIRCPRCGHSFAVQREGSAAFGVGATRPHAVEEVATAPDDGAAVAALAGLEARHGTPLKEAIARGTLFADFGTALMDAYDEYVRRTGSGASARFRGALRERWGVDLTPALDREPG